MTGTMLAFRAPVAPLRAFVFGYWCLDAPTGAGDVERYLPGATFAWIFGRSTPGTIRAGAAPGAQPRAFVKGVLPRATVIEAAGPTRNVGVAFQPGGAALFQRTAPEAFRGRLADVDRLGEAPLAELASRLEEASGVDEAATILDAHLLARLAEGGPLSVGPRLARRIAAGGVWDVRALVDASGYSERQLRRICQRELGASPKTLLRIARVRSAVRAIRDPAMPLTEVAHRHGYFDQAHFVHDFRAMVGMTPSAFREGETPLASQFG